MLLVVAVQPCMEWIPVINKVYNGKFVPELSVSMLKEIIAPVRYYVYIWNWEITSRTSEKYMRKQNIKSFSNETLNFSPESSGLATFWISPKILWTKYSGRFVPELSVSVQWFLLTLKHRTLAQIPHDILCTKVSGRSKM